jgi:hypothetical protein
MTAGGMVNSITYWEKDMSLNAKEKLAIIEEYCFINSQDQ